MFPQVAQITQHRGQLSPIIDTLLNQLTTKHAPTRRKRKVLAEGFSSGRRWTPRALNFSGATALKAVEHDRLMGSAAQSFKAHTVHCVYSGGRVR